ncbi:5-histidylcysteine sulfoxide synthase [Desulfogranum mediterraneum]|uniref:5-histidylcysteine sulfoxide synthase n=1 Tax=Desulfogranum mediterraneum TaxID=160661 RepID=UPI0003FEAC55|nr:5-histidylcysteine sulfoxide synthase [Desulfogranum mediterraneum]
MEQWITRTTVLNQGTAEEKRSEILQYFDDTFSLEDQLYAIPAGDQAFFLRAEPLRHPLIFYLGHTAAFYINKLITAKLTTTRINPSFESMFAVGVDEMSWDDLDSSHYDWPSLAAVREYRQLVRAFVEQQILSLPLEMPISWEDPFWVIMMGIEHQRIHLETSSVIIRRLPLEQVRQLAAWPVCGQSGEAPENSLVAVRGGRVVLGKERTDPLYGWDNEYGNHEAEVRDFAASKYLVSNGEFLSFVEAGGYHQQRFWSEEGWKWRSYARAEQPLFWIKDEQGYRYRTMASLIEMPWDWPVEVNYLEAKAFCNWLAENRKAPIRLPSEEEWYHLRGLEPIADQPYWERAPGNINLEYWASPCPVNRFSFGEFFDLIGNVWQWTETPISGFAGFEVHPCYDDFSTPTFDTRHNLIKGGSWISTGNEACRDARYGFRRHFFQHAGFRYLESEQPVALPEAMYETDAAVSQYCEAHYGPSYFGVENFPLAVARQALAVTAGRPRAKALDLGCAVGRTSFELAREFAFVQGIDFSARFIRIGFQMREKGVIRYELVEEGEIVSFHEHCLAEFGLESSRDKVEFSQGDASNLKPRFRGYDLIVAANLLDRLYDPAKFLTTIHERLNPGGVLVLTSPYTWIEEFTRRENWIGGFRQDGEPHTTLEGLKEILQEHFTLLAEPLDLPFVLRETGRKYQHTLAQLTCWERR